MNSWPPLMSPPLTSLEESRISLWSARATYSLYDIGPLEDVRLEVAANLDDYEPSEFGRCGQPYTIWLVCGKTFGLWSHGFAGIGLAGERHPQSFWESQKGLEFGARVEFRWDRFSFQVSDFWGYDDVPRDRSSSVPWPASGATCARPTSV